MKKQDWIINFAIVLVLVAIGVVFAVKYISPKNTSLVSIRHIDQIKLLDLNGNETKWDWLLADKGSTYCFVFSIEGCYSCIYRGLEDLKKLKKSGHHCIAILIHDYIDDARGWAATQTYAPFYILKKIDFYKYILTPMTPVMIKIEDGKVDSYNFINP